MNQPFDNLPMDTGPDDWTVGRLEDGLRVGDPRAEARKRELDEAYTSQPPKRRRPLQQSFGDLLAEWVAGVPNDPRIESATLTGTVESSGCGQHARWGTPTARRRATDYTATMDVTIVLARERG